MVGFIFPGSVSQVGVAMLAVLLVVIVHARFSPYSDKTQDAMQLTCQVLMFLVLFFSILIKAQAGEEAKGVDSTEFTEKCIIFCSIMPLVILVAQVYTNVVQPMWQVMHAKDCMELTLPVDHVGTAMTSWWLTAEVDPQSSGTVASMYYGDQLLTRLVQSINQMPTGG